MKKTSFEVSPPLLSFPSLPPPTFPRWASMSGEGGGGSEAPPPPQK